MRDEIFTFGLNGGECRVGRFLSMHRYFAVTVWWLLRYVVHFSMAKELKAHVNELLKDYLIKKVWKAIIQKLLNSSHSKSDHLAN
jgi:hypothetical protein